MRSDTQSRYKAAEKRYNALEKALNDYSTASFHAAKTASLGYLDAAIKELVDNANAEKGIYEREKQYYDGFVTTVEAASGSGIEAYAAAGTQAYTTVTASNGVNVRKSQAQTAISNAKLANKAVRIATDLVTGVTYKVSENIAWVSYYGKSITADVK